MENREPFRARYYGILNVEGEGEPVAMFTDRDVAEAHLARRRGLPEDHDDRLTDYHQIFPVDVVGVWWNSYDADPREKNPLTADEVIGAYRGDT